MGGVLIIAWSAGSKPAETANKVRRQSAKYRYCNSAAVAMNSGPLDWADTGARLT